MFPHPTAESLYMCSGNSTMTSCPTTVIMAPRTGTVCKFPVFYFFQCYHGPSLICMDMQKQAFYTFSCLKEHNQCKTMMLSKLLYVIYIL